MIFRSSTLNNENHGVFIGAWVRIKYLPNPKNFKFFVGFVPLYIGWRLLMDIYKPKNKRKDKNLASGPVSSHVVDVKTSTVKQVASSMMVMSLRILRQ